MFDSDIVFPSLDVYYARMHLTLKFPDKITFLYGYSGKGKTFVAKALSKQDLPVMMFDYTYVGDARHCLIGEFISNHAGFLIIIDNADILLDDDLRELIYFDKVNQFLLIGRDPSGLFLSAHNFVDIKKEGYNISFINVF